MNLMGNWCPLDIMLYSRSLNNLTVIVAPINKDCNIEYDKNYYEQILKGEISMEVIEIKDNIATLSNGVVTRHIDLNKDYLKEVDEVLKELCEKERYYEEIKNSICTDQKVILDFLIKGEKGNDR